jgi:hypothetical protein
MSEESLEPKKSAGKFQKGVSGNVKGSEKGARGRTWTSIVKDMAIEIAEGTKTRREIILDKVMLKAQRGERWAVELLWERLEGKAVSTQLVDVTSGGQSLNAAVSFCKVGEVKTVDALPSSEEVEQVDSEEPLPVRNKIQW